MTNTEIIGFATLSFAIVGGYIKLREGIAETKIKVSLLWDAWKDAATDAAKILHKPHPESAFMDSLLDKFLEGVISRDELKKLVQLLNLIIDNKEIDSGERTAASTLLRAIQIQYQV